MGGFLLSLLVTALINEATTKPILTQRFVSIPAGFSRTLFHDDFSALAAGSQPSSSKWTIQTGTSYPGGPANWGTREVQTYTNSRDNLIITPSGTLRITPIYSNGRWTSARIESTAANDFACPANGKLRVEASLKFSPASAATQMGLWPSFWSLGSDFRGRYDQWPAAGEVDIGESINGAASVWQTLHCGTAPGGPCNEFEGIGTMTPLSRGEFHTIAVEIDRAAGGGDWRGERLTWFVDGRQTASVDGWRVNDERAWTAVTRRPKFLILNLAVGGDFPNNVWNDARVGTPNSQTRGGVEAALEVRYVAVFST
ncbi:concanavalin A-like lectin/glucanase domain-containing protein [Bombardia bombarda]|uniref:Concanavalin A-like lectin/glucanase domain-containing protein n=1 Tax=Bombardia bombarda TaxID=252184 RepID=A0AA40C8R1_9PEZI|nr:concanavalin A-like lectin/glucanase domain-containing protein [Bombardia bombarda]